MGAFPVFRPGLPTLKFHLGPARLGRIQDFFLQYPKFLLFLGTGDFFFTWHPNFPVLGDFCSKNPGFLGIREKKEGYMPKSPIKPRRGRRQNIGNRHFLCIVQPAHYFPYCQTSDDPADMTAFPHQSSSRSVSWKIPCWHTAPLRRRGQTDLDASLCLRFQFCLFLLLIRIPGRQHCRSQPFCYCFIGTPILHLIHEYKCV